jgi:tRNA nucleotidyltransferase/poly(A) polymerase/2'-5' RNA ligase
MGESVHCPELDPKLHSVILERSLAYLGLPITYSLIGGRTCGSAYLSGGRVYKVTTDKSEAIESNKIVGKNNQHLVNVYNVKKVNNPLTNVDVYLIVMEHLRTDREAIFADIEEALINLFEEAFDKHFLDIIYYYRFSPEIYKNEYEDDVNQLLSVHQREKYYYDSLLKIADELRSNGIESLDLQYHNLGLKPNGNLGFFDLGYGDTRGNVGAINVNERVKSYMKNSSAVGIAKKCKFGGNPDGTSNACNKGDISNITMKPIKEGQDVKIEYGALMLNFDIDNWKDITSIIDKDDVYDKPTFGIEHQPHVTILYGFHTDVSVKDIKDLFNEKHDPKNDIEIKLVGISHFETPNYDVVKFDVESDRLVDLNKLMKKLPHTSTHPKYHPHLTISYVKKGTGKKYDKKFDENVSLKSNKVVYSTVKGSKTAINEHTSRHNKIYQKKMVSEEVKIDLNDLPFKKDVEQAGGKLYSVGGAVRDKILGKESKDLDILITGIPLDQLETILSKYGKVDNVGKSFGIIKFNTPQTGEIDIAIPRTERKNDQGGYQGFDVTSDHTLPIEKDLERRDFTINAIAKDSSGLMIDPYGGQGDIEKKQIKMVNPQAFSDDPLRMLRAVQFAARFGFNIEESTMQAIQQNAAKIREISPERILIEFDKIVKKGNQMVGAKLLRQTGLYNQIFGVNRGINLADFNKSKTMGEFIFGLIGNAVLSPANFYKTNLKGDLETYAELKALELGKNFNGDKKTIFDMYKTYPNSIETNIFGQELKNTVEYMRSHNIPFSLKDVPVNGNDLMQFGLQGKQIGDTFVDILNKIYKEELPNEREAILNYVKNKK